MDMSLNLGILILAHKNEQQCVLLIEELLLYPQAQVFVHVDLKSRNLYNALKVFFKEEARVQILEECYSVDWGSYNQIRATIALLKKANSLELDYYCLISAQDFPIQTLGKLSDFLVKHQDKQFVVHFPLPDQQWELGGLKRLEWFHLPGEKRFPLRGRLNGLVHRVQKLLRYNRKIEGPFFGGSNWFNLSGSAVKWICEYLEKNPNYLKQFRLSRCADEIFIQTLIMRSPFALTVINDDLRLVDWSRGPEYPRTFRTEDLDLLLNQKEKFFARKFDNEMDSKIIKIISERNKKS